LSFSLIIIVFVCYENIFLNTAVNESSLTVDQFVYARKFAIRSTPKIGGADFQPRVSSA